jgi:ABC-type multidrug transport system fused ATPase/permease subunit
VRSACFEVLDREDEVPDAPNAKALASCRGEIVFENVSFGYSSERPVFSGVNLRIAPGQTVAFVGSTGAGKSTLLSLVPRFYEPTAGRVLLDGHDLRSLTKRSLRNQISIVLQDTLLFSTTGSREHRVWPAGRIRGRNHRGREARAGS